MRPFFSVTTRRGDVVAVQFLERVFADPAEVGAAEIHQRFALEGIELQIDFEIGFIVRETFDEIFFLGDAKPVRIHHQMADGARLRQVQIAKKSGWTVGSPPESWTTSGWPSLRTTASSMFSTAQGCGIAGVRAAVGVADRAAQVAVVADLEQREAGVLLVVGAKAAVVGASPLDGRVVNERHLRGLDEDLAAAAVVVDVVGDEDAFGAVFRAAFEEIDVAVLEDDFGFDFAVAGGADRDGDVVEEVGAGFVGHDVSLG